MVLINRGMWIVVAFLSMGQASATEVVTVKTGVMSELEWNALAKKSNCLYCHALDHKILGPSFREVAAEYVGKPDAEAYLLKKVSEGGVGKWGGTSMPSQSPPATQDEIKALLRYILRLK